MDKKNSHTSEKILLAATVLFALHGYSEVSIREIINLANVNMAAINYHFGTKRELYIAVFKRVWGAVTEE
ncbi:MAG: TetR/AcrR family transcriptional regulator [Halieaceae bacterium]|nr:TetR/AcrR family transcriptional regulator [Halieaceae bacterium]